jgi:hypothetical protein
MRIAIATFLALLALAMAHANAQPVNLLVNGDFHDGINGWRGTLRVMQDADRVVLPSLDIAKGAPGAVIDLDNSGGGRAVTLAWQDFSCHGVPVLDYTLKYEFSNDYQPSDRGENRHVPDYNLPSDRDVTPETETYNDFISNCLGQRCHGFLPPMVGADFALVVADMKTGEFTGIVIHPTLGSIGVQTTDGHLEHISDGDPLRMALIFRGGTGKVALFNVSLTASDLPAANAPLMDKSPTIPEFHL